MIEDLMIGKTHMGNTKYARELMPNETMRLRDNHWGKEIIMWAR